MKHQCTKKSYKLLSLMPLNSLALKNNHPNNIKLAKCDHPPFAAPIVLSALNENDVTNDLPHSCKNFLLLLLET